MDGSLTVMEILNTTVLTSILKHTTTTGNPTTDRVATAAIQNGSNQLIQPILGLVALFLFALLFVCIIIVVARGLCRKSRNRRRMNYRAPSRPELDMGRGNSAFVSENETGMTEPGIWINSQSEMSREAVSEPPSYDFVISEQNLPVISQSQTSDSVSAGGSFNTRNGRTSELAPPAYDEIVRENGDGGHLPSYEEATNDN